MKLGLLGEKLTHSFSPKISQMLADIKGFQSKYDLFEVDSDDLPAFFAKLKSGQIDACNITIPYKEITLTYLDEISNEAKEIGAVNTIVSKNGKLSGYNSDYYGFGELLHQHFIDVKDNEFSVLGAGGSAKAIVYYLVKNGANNVCIYTRNIQKAKSNFTFNSDKMIFKTYDQMDLNDMVLINTTPLGMFPKLEECAISQDDLSGCNCVIDIIYNPPLTKLLINAKQKKIPSINGFYMLVAQAIKSAEIWYDQSISSDITRMIYQKLDIQDNNNIILTGMPGCGKTSIGKELASTLNIPFLDMDEYIENKYGSIDTLFKKGEQHFRNIESKVAAEITNLKNTIICTGGGVIKNKKNIQHLSTCGTIIFIDRPIDHILFDIKHSTRPLLNGTDQSVFDLYKKRIDLYRKYCHLSVKNDGTIRQCVNNIIDTWKGYTL